MRTQLKIEERRRYYCLRQDNYGKNDPRYKDAESRIKMIDWVLNKNKRRNK